MPATSTHNIPRSWVARVRESMARLTPIYSANRSVREYVERCYLPAAASYHDRARNNGALGMQISAWAHALERDWHTLRFGRIQVETRGDRHHFTVQVELGAVDPAAVRVELYAEPLDENPAFRQAMTRGTGQTNDGRIDEFFASVPAIRSAADYTARVAPTYPDVQVPLEAPHVLWQR